MPRCLPILKGIFFAAVCVCCILACALHSFYYYLKFQGATEATKSVRSSVDQLALPLLLVCNKLPYTQAGLSNLARSTSNQQVVEQYLTEWLDPSARSAEALNPPEALSASDMQQAESLLAQQFPLANLQERLQQILPQCQDVLSSCSFKGQVVNSYECCQQAQAYISTTNGICLAFGNQSLVQGAADFPAGLQITFQIPRNSFFSNSRNVHPGLQLFLKQPKTDAARLATELETPLYLTDKRALLVRVQKECLLRAAVEECRCYPLMAVLWTFQGYLDGGMLRQVNASAVCTVNQYNQCVRKYVDMAKPAMWAYEIPTTLDRMKSAVDYCRSSVQMSCQRVEFPSNTHEYDLPQEYRNTQDFVARITLSYESLVVTDVLETYEMGIYDFLMFVGYNVALWFAVGHIIWSIVTTPCGWFCDHNKNKVTPKADTAVVATVKPSSSPLRSARKQLPPLQHSPRSGTDKTLTYAVESNGGPSQMPDG